MAFDNSFLSFQCFVFLQYPVFPPLSFFLAHAKWVKKNNPNMNENCLSQRSLFVTQILAANETILLATERLEVSLQKLFTELGLSEQWSGSIEVCVCSCSDI